MFNFVTLIGFMAAVFTTAAFLPQVIKTVKTRHTKDISLGMYIIFITGLILWEIYGLLIYSPPIIIANLLTLILAGWILVLKIRHG